MLTFQNGELARAYTYSSFKKDETSLFEGKHDIVFQVTRKYAFRYVSHSLHCETKIRVKIHVQEIETW